MENLLNYLLSFELIDWAIENLLLLIASIFTIMLSVVGLANRALPSRDDVSLEFYKDQQIGENSKLWQVFSKFRQNNAPTNLSDTSLDAKNLSGVHAIPEGEQAFNVRILLAQLAERTLDLQYYMWHDDASGRLMFYEVWKAAERGVRVRILLDDNNTGGMDAVLQTLNNHRNIQLRLFNPFMNRRFRVLGYMTALKRLNRRMHNKSFTADNQVTIFGGRNIGDEYFDADKEMNFADLDVVAIGSVVDEISKDFDKYWNAPASFPIDKIVTKTYQPVDLSKTADEQYDISTENYRQSLDKSDFLSQLDLGTLNFEWVKVQFVSDSPDKVLDMHHKGENLIEQIKDTLTTPKRSLTIVSPYFVPMDKWTQKFVDLAQKGIDLNILTNSLTANDVIAVHAGYMRYRQRLLEGNVKLFELKSNLKAKQHRDEDSSNPLAKTKQLAHDTTEKVTAKVGETISEHLPSTLNKNPHRTEENPLTGSRKQNRKHQARQKQRSKAHWIRNAGSSLHAKTFSVDGERLFVGSFNFDPRSALLNTEMGAIIESPILAKQLDDTIERWTSELSYVVSMNNGKICWSDESLDPTKDFTYEPESNWRQRLLVWIIGKLPIEDFL